MFRIVAKGLLDLLSPPECPGCELAWEPLEAGVPFCLACAPLIELPPSGLRPPARLAAAVAYQGPVADAIRRFKYGGASFLAPQLGWLIVRAARLYAGHVDAIVPMPLHPTKLRERGFNPSALLARPVATALGLPMRVDWLLRRRATSSQAGLSSAARQQNVLGAFVARRVGRCRVLLIDDVYTTGATVGSAAAALRAGGHDVIALALAWAPTDQPTPAPAPAEERGPV